jgi:hypothetical protein
MHVLKLTLVMLRTTLRPLVPILRTYDEIIIHTLYFKEY